MAKWIQNTRVTRNDGTVKDSEKIVRTEERMIEMMAQVSFLRQAGEDIRLNAETDMHFNVERYIVHCKLKDREVEMIFTKE